MMKQRASQARKTQMVPKGIETRIHCVKVINTPTYRGQENFRRWDGETFSRLETARAFWRLEIGVIMPPKLQEMATPRRRDLV
jgi:hypothetical protein